MMQRVNLHPQAREPIFWTVSTEPVPSAQFEVSFDAGASWHSATRTNNTVEVLVAGPDATSDDPVGTVRLTRGQHDALLRVVEFPSIYIDCAGAVAVVEC